MCAELEEALLGIDEARLDGLVEALLGQALSLWPERAARAC